MRLGLLLIVTMLVCAASPARAQDAQRWTDPSGRVSLAFSALGWTELEPRADEPGTLLGIENRALQASGRMRTCFVTERRQAGPADGRLTQSNLNAITSSRGQAGLERTIGRAPAHSEILTVDGVALVDAVFDGEWRQHIRVFFMKDHADYVQILINCGMTPPVEPEVEENIAQLLRTLRIRPE